MVPENFGGGLGRRNVEVVRQSGLNSFPTALTSKDGGSGLWTLFLVREVSGLSLMACEGHKTAHHKLPTLSRTHHASVRPQETWAYLIGPERREEKLVVADVGYGMLMFA